MRFLTTMGRELSSPNRDLTAHTASNIYYLSPYKVCQLLSLTNYQVLSFIHSNTLVPNAGIDMNRHKTHHALEDLKNTGENTE